MSKVLCVEDDEDVLSLMKDLLTERDLAFVGAPTAAEAERILLTQIIDLVLLDIGLPDQDGFDLCKRLQGNPATRDIPVIFMTGSTEVDKKIAAFKMGADDYVVKPFNHRELLARIESKIEKKTRNHEELIRGPIRISLQNQQVVIETGGRQKSPSLTRLEFKLLHFFAQNENQVFSRESLLKNIWGIDAKAGPRTIDAHICSLRRKLSPFSHYLESVTGSGYRFSQKAIKRIRLA